MPTVICLGAAVWDTIFQVDRIPSAGIKVLPTRAVQLASGMAANAAIASARLGADVRLWARLGADDTGRRFLRALERERVEASCVRLCEGADTPYATILVDRHGERAVVPWFDPRLPSDASWLPLDQVRGAGAVRADMRWPDGAAALLARARELGVPAILDADTAPAPDYARLMPLATHVVFSEVTLAIVAPGQAPQDALRSLAARLDADVIGVTLGARGALVGARGTKELLHVAAPKIDAVDTLAAGDTWHGAYACGIAEGRPLAEAVRRANVAAAMKCEVFGGSTGAPTRAALEARLAAEA